MTTGSRAGREIRPDLRLNPFTLQADEEKLRAVVANLVSNAIKYSPTGYDFQLALRQQGERSCIDIRPTQAPEFRSRSNERNLRLVYTR